MAGPSATQQSYLTELEYHISALDELLHTYECGLRNALGKNDRPLIRTLTGRIAYHTQQLEQAKRRRTKLQHDLYAKDRVQ